MILKLSEARYGFVPKFYGQDSAVIVDSDKVLTQTNQASFKYPTKLRRLPPPPFPLWRHYSRYHIIPPPPPGQIQSIYTWPKSKTKPVQIATTTTTTSSTTTTTTPKPITTTSTTVKSTTTSPFITEDEFPKELLDIAQNKLGLKSLDEIPSISELGQLLGTNNPEETLNYIKQLTSNEQGVALVKAYIESTDYTDNSGDLVTNNEDLEDEDIDGDIEEPVKVNDEGLIVITDEDSNDDYEMETEGESTTLKPRKTSKIVNRLKQLPPAKPGFMERVVNYMHLNNLFHKTDNNEEVVNKQEENVEIVTDNANYNVLNRITEQEKKISLEEPILDHQMDNENTNDIDESKTPILIREPIPFNYPVPIRAQSSTSTTTATPVTLSQPSDTTTVVHLNTPKILIPHVQQLSRVTKIPSKQIEDFLASKPKLLELATKVSRFPIGYDRQSPMEAQVLAAVQKAFEQDEDLKKLLSSTATLK